MKKVTPYLCLFFLVLSLGLAGCSDDDDDDPIVRLSGTAATGAPLASATVTVCDAAGNTRTATTQSNGDFTVDVAGLTAPFALKVTFQVEAQERELYSCALAAGRANINPLTNIMASAAAGAADPADLFTASGLHGLTAESLTSALTAVRTMLQPLLAAYDAADIDPLTDACPANHEGLDAVLDVIDISFTGGTVTVYKHGDETTPLAQATVNDQGMTNGDVLDDDDVNQIGKDSLAGRYNFVDFSLNVPSDEDNGGSVSAGHVTFKTDKSYASVTAANSDNDKGSETGTYTLDAMGHLTFTEDDIIQGLVTVDKDVILIADKTSEPGSERAFSVLVKKNAVSALEGDYVSVSFSRELSGEYGTKLDANIYTFDATAKTWIDANDNADHGGYAIDADGQLTITDSDEDTSFSHGIIAKNGEMIFLVDYCPGATAEIELSVLVKIPGSAATLADLDGAFTFAELSATSGGVDGDFGDIDILNGTITTAEGTIPVTPASAPLEPTFSYTPDVYGFSYGGLFGLLCADKNLLMGFTTNPGDAPAFNIMVRNWPTN